jgi:pilus assembly protein CpaF
MNRDLELLISFLQPIRGLLLDDSVSEIMGNPDGTWWYERDGHLYRADAVSFDAVSLRTGLEVIANKLGRKLDSDHPMLNVQLPDGSRLAAVMPPVVRPFPSVTIRKFATVRFSVNDLIARRTMDGEMAVYLRAQITAGRTLLISGGTGSGKTTLLNALAEFIPDCERLVIIEDTAELRIEKPNVLAAECQVAVRGGTVDFNALLRGALRWRPDRIILGEVRGEEARTLLDSFNTGHAGSMATIHASSAVKALRRFGELAMRSHQQATRDDLATEIAESVQLVVQIQRTPGGRRVTEIIEVHGYDRDRKVFLYEFTFNAHHTPAPNTKEMHYATA